MLSQKSKPNTSNEIKAILNPIISKWFFNRFKEFSLPQLYGVMEVHNHNNVLISAPTGSTKTLTSFLSVLNELVNLSEKNELEDKVYCIYISPLKALNNDIGVNLIEPLKDMEKQAEKELGIRVGVRTGDTTQKERAAMLKKSPHILITTPESLAIILNSPKFLEKLNNLKWVIVDEIHALADSKRGTHLSLTLERLQYSTKSDFARIGLSATISPLEEIAKYLVGYNKDELRDCKIVDVQFLKKMDLKVLSPAPDLINITHEKLHSKMYELIDSLIQDHKTTLIFTNTRSATERVVNYLKDKFPGNYTENIGAHHGSLSKAHRQNLEKRLREGKLKVVVCSTSLELGIDIGFIDLVILLGSPKSVARGLQRIGRSGHKLHEEAKGRIIVLDRDDLIENGVLLKSAIEKKIDNIHIPKNALDVLSQHIYGIAISDRINIESLFSLIKQSYCYHDMDEEDFMEVIRYLAGSYSSLEDRHVYAKIWYDEQTGEIGKKGKLARVIYMTNIGTIPDESSVRVKIKEEVIGFVDEGFLERLKPGDVFVLGGQKYEFMFSRGMTAQVKTAIDRPPTIPSWFSEMLPLSFELALEIGKFRRLMEDKFKHDMKEEEILQFINDYLYVDSNAGRAIYNYFKEQYLYAEIPNDKKILVEYYSEDNTSYVVFHSLFGRRVNDVLSRAFTYAVSSLQHKDVEFGINDNGFYLKGEKINIARALSTIKSYNLRETMNIAIDKTEVMKRRFRHCATRALMILRSYKGHVKNVGRQQVNSMLLLSAVKKISENFSILKEARREVLEDLMDIESASKILEEIEKGNIKIKEISTNLPSPFAFNIVLQGYIDVMKIEDKQEFLRRMHHMVLAKIGKKHII